MFRKIILPAVFLAASTCTNAGIISPLNDGSWTVMGGASEDQTTYKLTPGYGGQYFDAEYLLYKFDTTSNIFSIALQTGFDITGDNKITYGNKTYWGGDLALSFDGSTAGALNGYEYAIDFGQATGGYYDSSATIAEVTAGLYSVYSWNNSVYSGHTASIPFAMQSGSWAGAVNFSSDSAGYYNSQGYGGNNTSYYKTMSFDLDDIAGLDVNSITQIDAHWTMSCGNDAIDGSIAVVPEPSVLFLMSTGLLVLFGSVVARRKKMH